LDEGKLANPETKTNQQIAQFMGDYGDKNGIVLNGTPAQNDLRDLYGFIEFVSPGTYRSKLHFNMKHVVFKPITVKVEKRGELTTREIDIVDKFINTDELYANLFKNARRVEKSQVLELKEKNIIPVHIDLSDSHLNRYKKFVAELLLEFPDGSILKGTTSASLKNNAFQAVVHCDILGLNEVSEVFNAAETLIDNILATGRKALIFCHHRKTVEALAEYFKKLNPAVIYGGSDTEKNKDKFLKDPECRLAVANYQSGGVGLNLQSVCSDIVCVEPTTVPGQFDQATDRVHRSGQKEIVNVYVLVPNGTAFVKSVKDLTRKKLVVARVVSKATIIDELLGQDTASTAYVQSQAPSGLDDLTGGWQEI
jgi:SNF2 family DNA or RNA helicase